MKFAIKSIVAAAAFAAAGLSNAVPFNLAVSEFTTSMGWHAGELSGTADWNFSRDLVGLLNVGSFGIGQPTQVASVAPAVTSTTFKPAPRQTRYSTISVAAPVQSFTGAFDGTSASVYGIQTKGGVAFTADADDFVSDGGFLAITNLRVDLVGKKIYADLNGDHGLGVKTNVAMWDISTVVGATSFVAASGINTLSNSLTGLKLNTNAFAMFSQAMGLTNDGENALHSVREFGTINTTISIASVPEPSVYAMIGMGLLVIGAVGRRRKASMSLPTKTHVG